MIKSNTIRSPNIVLMLDKSRRRVAPEILLLLAPAVTVGETEGAMDSASVFFCLFFCL